MGDVTFIVLPQKPYEEEKGIAVQQPDLVFLSDFRVVTSSEGVVELTDEQIANSYIYMERGEVEEAYWVARLDRSRLSGAFNGGRLKTAFALKVLEYQ